MEQLDVIIKNVHNRIIEIPTFNDGTIKRFKKFSTFHNFIQKEVDFWKNYNKGLLNEIYNHFNQINRNLISAVNNISTNISTAENSLNQAISLSKINKLPFLISETSLSKFLINLYNINNLRADGAYSFLKNTIDTRINQKEYFIGLISAFNYINLDETLKNKLSAEELSLGEISKKYTESIDSLEIYYNNKTQEVDESIIKFKDELTNWQSSTTKSYDETINQKKIEFEELKKFYEEKLRIDSPAKYWEELHEEYNTKGKNWKNWSIFLSVLLITLLTFILYFFPSSFDITKGILSSTNIKGTIIFTLIVSVAIYLIRFFIKLSTSAFHLSRDAKERFQLTHIYLSMLKEGALKEEDRLIILQSLFSRADTGLLKGDSSPKLPGDVGVLSNIIKNLK